MSKTYISYPSYHYSLFELAREHDLIVTDLDDVIITPVQYFCGSLWFSRKMEKATNWAQKQEAISHFYECMNNTEITPVSAEFNFHLSLLSTEKTVIGLTARDSSVTNETNKSLKKVGMSFSKTIDHPLLIDGVIYGGQIGGISRNKGQVLDDLLNDPQFTWVKSIIFIDDSAHNTINVQKSLWDNKNHDVTVVHFTDIATKFNCDYTREEHEILGIFQHRHFNLYREFLSDQDVLGEVCPLVTAL